MVSNSHRLGCLLHPTPDKLTSYDNEAIAGLAVTTINDQRVQIAQLEEKLNTATAKFSCAYSIAETVIASAHSYLESYGMDCEGVDDETEYMTTLAEELKTQVLEQ